MDERLLYTSGQQATLLFGACYYLPRSANIGCTVPVYRIDRVVLANDFLRHEAPLNR